jgi:O-antigen ligase
VRGIGAVVAVAVIGLGVAGVIVATHGNPVSFVKRQWHGFVHIQYVPSSTHFFSVGSGRYDFWRVSVDEVKAHPLGGLGQDNFAEYYVTRRHTGDEPRWTHSLEFRLLAHTGIVGFVLFAGFLIAALVAAVGAIRSRSPMLAAAAAGAVIPLIPWVVHGSVGWFWEVPHYPARRSRPSAWPDRSVARETSNCPSRWRPRLRLRRRDHRGKRQSAFASS